MTMVLRKLGKSFPKPWFIPQSEKTFISHEKILHEKILHEKILHEKMAHEKMAHEKMAHELYLFTLQLVKKVMKRNRQQSYLQKYKMAERK